MTYLDSALSGLFFSLTQRCPDMTLLDSALPQTAFSFGSASSRTALGLVSILHYGHNSYFFNKALLHQFDLFEGIFETLKFCLYPDLCDGAVEGHRGLKGGENKEMLGSNTGQG